MKGVLVVFEGIDGSGKSTQAELLYQRLKEMGLNLYLGSEPTDSHYGKIIRKISDVDTDISLPLEEEYRIFLEDRRLHVKEKILPSLMAGRVVILDRYYHSTMAYQGAKGIDPKRIEEENESFAPRPDLLFLMDLDVNEAIKRIRDHRGSRLDSFEKREYLMKVLDLYRSFNHSYIRRIDAKRDKIEIHQEIFNEVKRLIFERGKG